MKPSKPSGSEGFPKSARVRRRSEFLKIQDTGKKSAAGLLLAMALPRSDRTDETRLGITVSKKVGNAVARARIRRRLRELFRKSRGQLPRGLDLVFVARRGAAEAEASELGRAFATVADRLRGMFP